MRIPFYFFLSFLFLVSCLPFTGKHFNTKLHPDFIEFEKTRCLGKCKAYTIRIDRDGITLLEGIANTDLTGKYSRKLSRKENKSFWKLIDSASLETMKEEYDYGAEDSQQKFIRYHKNGNTKEIRFGQNVPEILKRIDAEIERIMEDKGWQIVSP